MKVFGMDKKLLSELLDEELSKRVFAFEEISLESLEDYIDWAIASLGKGLDDALQPLVSYYGQSSINYFELQADLRAFFATARIAPPKGKNAVRLYCLGCVQGVVNGLRSERSMLQHMADLLRSYTDISEFDWIIKLDDRFWNPQENESCDDVLKLFLREAERVVAELDVVLNLQNGCWQVNVS